MQHVVAGVCMHPVTPSCPAWTAQPLAALVSGKRMSCRARWAAGPAVQPSIEANLGKVSNLPWVVQQCLTRTGPTQADQAALLECGLQLSAAQVQGAALANKLLLSRPVQRVVLHWHCASGLHGPAAVALASPEAASAGSKLGSLAQHLLHVCRVRQRGGRGRDGRGRRRRAGSRGQAVVARAARAPAAAARAPGHLAAPRLRVSCGPPSVSQHKPACAAAVHLLQHKALAGRQATSSTCCTRLR